MNPYLPKLGGKLSALPRKENTQGMSSFPVVGNGVPGLPVRRTDNDDNEVWGLKPETPQRLIVSFGPASAYPMISSGTDQQLDVFEPLPTMDSVANTGFSPSFQVFGMVSSKALINEASIPSCYLLLRPSSALSSCARYGYRLDTNAIFSRPTWNCSANGTPYELSLDGKYTLTNVGNSATGFKIFDYLNTPSLVKNINEFQMSLDNRYTKFLLDSKTLIMRANSSIGGVSPQTFYVYRDNGVDGFDLIKTLSLAMNTGNQSSGGCICIGSNHDLSRVYFVNRLEINNDPHPNYYETYIYSFNVDDAFNFTNRRTVVLIYPEFSQWSPLFSELMFIPSADGNDFMVGMNDRVYICSPNDLGELTLRITVNPGTRRIVPVGAAVAKNGRKLFYTSDGGNGNELLNVYASTEDGSYEFIEKISRTVINNYQMYPSHGARSLPMVYQR